MAVREVVPGGWGAISPAYRSWWDRMYGGGLGADGRQPSAGVPIREWKPWALRELRQKGGRYQLHGLGASASDLHYRRMMSTSDPTLLRLRRSGLGSSASDLHYRRMMSTKDPTLLRLRRSGLGSSASDLHYRRMMSTSDPTLLRLRRAGLGLDLGPLASMLPSGGIFDVAKGVVASRDAEKAAKSQEKAAAAQARTARFAAEAAQAEAAGTTARTKMLLIGGGLLVGGVALVLILRKRK